MKREISRAAGAFGVMAVASCAARLAEISLDSKHWFTETPAWLRENGIRRPELTIDLRASRTSVSVGDSIESIAVARNSSAARIQLARNCGPAMEVRVTAPTGQVESVILSRVADPSVVDFTCEGRPDHVVEARDSVVNRYWWRAPRRTGRYIAVAGGRFSDGLADVSSTFAVTVR